MIHLTYVGGSTRGDRESFDTDHAGDALARAMQRWYASGQRHPSAAAVFAVVVERDGVELSRGELIARLRDIIEMEEARAEREAIEDA